MGNAARYAICSTFVVSMLTYTLRAHAEGPEVAVPATPGVAHEQRPRWYGWQTYLIDVPSLSFVLLGIGISDGTSRSGDALGGTLVGAGLLGYFVASPGLHVLHGNPGGVWKSEALRVGTIGLGALGGYAIAAATCHDDPRPTQPSDGLDGDFNFHFGCDFQAAASAAVFGLAGAIAGSAVDGAWVAREPSHATSMTLLPTWSTATKTAGVSLVGTL